MLKEHYNADSMIVATVTTSVTRLENIHSVAEKADTGLCPFTGCNSSPQGFLVTPIPPICWVK